MSSLCTLLDFLPTVSSTCGLTSRRLLALFDSRDSEPVCVLTVFNGFLTVALPHTYFLSELVKTRKSSNKLVTYACLWVYELLHCHLHCHQNRWTCHLKDSSPLLPWMDQLRFVWYDGQDSNVRISSSRSPISVDHPQSTSSCLQEARPRPSTV